VVDGPLNKDGTLDSSFPIMFEKWVVQEKQNGSVPAEQYPQKALSSTMFQSYLSEFIFAGGGMSYIGDLTFEEKLTCTAEAPKLKMISVAYSHKK
jgi:hypothetical protein